MIYDPRRDKVLWISAAVAAFGVALLILPAPSPAIAPFPAAPQTTAEPRLATDPAPAIDTRTDLVRLTAMFDHSDLPAAPPPVMPPPDPAAELRRFRFAGAAIGGERRAALFEANGDVRTLGAGEALAGFVLNRIESNEAVFVKDGLEVVLPLTPQ
jgi:hypothetical protein